MPIFEYKCPNGHQFETIVYSNEKEPTSCKMCKVETPVEKVITIMARYDFVGENPASVTPKKFRGMKSR